MATVLIVDDHAGFRRQARQVVEAAGHVVVGEADDGASALKAAHELQPDIVLLDIQLPDIDGFAVSAQLEGPAVVLISGRDRAVYRSRLATTTARGFIAKIDLSPRSLAALLGTA